MIDNVLRIAPQPIVVIESRQLIALLQLRSQVCVLEAKQPTLHIAPQPVLRLRLVKSISAHREVVTFGGDPVTHLGEEVWVMVPDA